MPYPHNWITSYPEVPSSPSIFSSASPALFSSVSQADPNDESLDIKEGFIRGIFYNATFNRENNEVDGKRFRCYFENQKEQYHLSWGDKEFTVHRNHVVEHKNSLIIFSGNIIYYDDYHAKGGESNDYGTQAYIDDFVKVSKNNGVIEIDEAGDYTAVKLENDSFWVLSDPALIYSTDGSEKTNPYNCPKPCENQVTQMRLPPVSFNPEDKWEAMLGHPTHAGPAHVKALPWDFCPPPPPMQRVRKAQADAKKAIALKASNASNTNSASISTTHRKIYPKEDGKRIDWDFAKNRTKNAVKTAFDDSIEPTTGEVEVPLATARPPMGTVPPRPKV